MSEMIRSIGIHRAKRAERFREYERVSALADVEREKRLAAGLPDFPDYHEYYRRARGEKKLCDHCMKTLSAWWDATWRRNNRYVRRAKPGQLCECEAAFTLTETRAGGPDGTNYGTAISCPCGWAGRSHRRTKAGTYKVVDCPGCGNAVARLTPEQVAVVEMSSGRPIHENEAIVLSVIARRFRKSPRWLREKLYDAGMERLIHCMICYDPANAKGANFGTYAFRCVQLCLLKVYKDAYRELNRDTEQFREYAELTHLYRPQMVDAYKPEDRSKGRTGNW